MSVKRNAPDVATRSAGLAMLSPGPLCSEVKPWSQPKQAVYHGFTERLGCLALVPQILSALNRRAASCLSRAIERLTSKHARNLQSHA